MRNKRTYPKNGFSGTEALSVEFATTAAISSTRPSSRKFKTASIAIPKGLLSENYDSDITIHEWNKTNATGLFRNAGYQSKNEFPGISLLVFKMSKKGMEKVEWKNLHQGMKKAFKEVINTFFSDKDISDKLVGRSECFTFNYSDSEVALSAMCVILNRRMTFYYRDENIV